MNEIKLTSTKEQHETDTEKLKDVISDLLKNECKGCKKLKKLYDEVTKETFKG